MISKKPKLIVDIDNTLTVHSSSEDYNNKKPRKDVIDKLISYKKEVGRHVGRNPFQEGPLYNGWLFEFNLDNFPNCLK